MRLRNIFISPGHNFLGHYGRPAGEHRSLALAAAECVAGRGLRGDRFFDHPPDQRGQVTFFSAEVWDALRAAFGRPGLSPAVLRRNLISADADLNALIGRRFSLQEVEFEGTEECRPCFWMDRAVAPGAEQWLRGRGGLRCRVLRGGRLQAEPG